MENYEKIKKINTKKTLSVHINLKNKITNIYLPETTKASFGPQVTNPQVIF